jgi:hypothetical protein
LDAGHQQQVQGNERVFHPDGDQSPVSCNGNVLWMPDVVLPPVGNQDTKWLERPGGKEALNLLRRHAANATTAT